MQTTPWFLKTSANELIKEVSSIKQSGDNVATSFNAFSSNFNTYSSTINGEINYVSGEITSLSGSYKDFSGKTNTTIGEIQEALKTSSNWVNRSELSTSSKWDESYNYYKSASANISSTSAWVTDNGNDVIQSASDALEWTQKFISNSGYLIAGPNITISTAENGILIDATTGGGEKATVIHQGQGINVSAVSDGYKVGVDNEYLSGVYQLKGDYATSGDATGDVPYVLSGGKWVQATNLISMYKTSKEGNMIPVVQSIFNYNGSNGTDDRYNYINVVDFNDKNYNMYTLLKPFSQSFTYDKGISGIYNSADNTIHLSSFGGEGSMNPPDEDGDWIYKVSGTDYSGWYDISQESSELSGGNGIEVTTEGNVTTIGLEGGLLEFSAGNGIGINVEGNILTISADGTGGITKVEVSEPLSGDGSESNPIGISGGVVEISAGEGIGIKEEGNVLVISSKGGDSYYNIALENGCEPYYEYESKTYSGYTFGLGTIADTDYATIVGKYNNPQFNNDILFGVGNGESEDSRSNAFYIDVNSNIVGGDNYIEVGKFNTIFGINNSSNESDFIITNGYSNKFSAFDNGIINGNSNSVRDCDGVTINGMSNSATSVIYSFLAGLGNAISGAGYSTIYGNANKIGKAGLGDANDGNYNYVNGYGNTSMGEYNQLLGQQNLSVGALNFLVGAGNRGMGSMGMLLGTNNQTTPVAGGMPYNGKPYDGCIIMGMGLSANAPMQIIMGSRNDPSDRILKVNREEGSTESDDYSWPMFVLAGDSNPELPAGSGQNSHTIYKDGQIRLRFDNPNYGENGDYSLDTVVINYPYFVNAEEVKNVVKTYSSTFGYLEGSDTVTITPTSNNGISGYKFEANMEGFKMDDYFKVSANEGSNSIHVSAQTAEGGKVTYWLSADAGGVTNNLDGENGIYVDNNTHKVGISADVYDIMLKPSAIYQYDDEGKNPEPMAYYSGGFFHSNRYVEAQVYRNLEGSVNNGRSWSTTWAKMILPLSSDIMTQDMIENGINLMVVPTGWSKSEAIANTVYLQVEEDD